MISLGFRSGRPRPRSSLHCFRVDIGVSIVIMQSAARAIDIIIAWKGSQLIQPNPGSGGHRSGGEEINQFIGLALVDCHCENGRRHACCGCRRRTFQAKALHIPCRSILVCSILTLTQLAHTAHDPSSSRSSVPVSIPATTYTLF